MKELNVVEIEAVGGALDIQKGIEAGVRTYLSTSNLELSISVGIWVAINN